MKKMKNALEGCAPGAKGPFLDDAAGDLPSVNAAMQRVSDSTYRRGLKKLGIPVRETAFGYPSGSRFGIVAAPGKRAIVLKAVR